MVYSTSMPPGDMEKPDLYSRLVDKGVPKQDIAKVYRSLRDRGYGEEEARRRSREALARMKAKRDMEERRKAGRTSKGEGEAKDGRPAGAPGRSAAAPGLPASEKARRATDWVAPLPLPLRRKINGWSYRKGLRLARLPERFNDFLSLFDRTRKDFASRDFLALLGARRGYLTANPYDYSIADAVDALRHSARRLLGGERPARRIAEREAAKQIEEEVRRSLRAREPFAIDFLDLFAAPSDMLQRSLAYAGSCLEAGLRVEVAALARAVKEAGRLVSMGGEVEVDALDGMFDIVRQVNLAHDRGQGASTELLEAESLFRAAFQNMRRYRRELYPALLKMIGAFYEEEDDSEEKKTAIFSFLELREDMVLTYAGHQKRTAEAREKALAEQKQRELERLEQEKREKFSYRFEGTLTILASLFPGSDVERIEQGAFIAPYFLNRVFNRHPVTQRRQADLERLSSGDVMGLIAVVHMIVEDLLDSVNGYALEKIIGREGVGTSFAEVRESWKAVYDTLFEPYLDEIRELARESTGDPRYVRLFKDSMRARGIEERINQIRNHAIKSYGHIIAVPSLYEGPKLFELAEKLAALLSQVGEAVNPDLLGAEDPLRKSVADGLAATPVVDFTVQSRPGTPEYRPVTRQLRRYVEARYRRGAAEIPAVSTVVFFDAFRGIADLYAYLLNDSRSFAAAANHSAMTAGEEEQGAWTQEKGERGREAGLALQARLTEDFPGQFLDELTGLKNKNFFVTELPRRVEKLRANGKPLTLLMIDIDHFKWVNDALGHQDGDGVLKTTAEVVLDNIREGDLAIRYGGEEILVLLPADLHTGVILAERLRHTQEQNLLVRPALMGVKVIGDDRGEPCGTLSIGVAMASGVEEVGLSVERADRALYAAKKTRNVVVIVDPDREGAEPYTSYTEYRRRSRGSDQ
jgi:diguanylate cyclase (GGDEF)-like protein